MIAAAADCDLLVMGWHGRTHGLRLDSIACAVVDGGVRPLLLVRSTTETLRFTALAEQYSQSWSDTAKDDLGWITTSATEAYESYAFDTATAIGAVSDPIKDTAQTTKGGYWLFKVLDSATQDMASDDKTDLENAAFNTWLKALQADTVNYKIINSLDDTKKAFATKQFST